MEKRIRDLLSALREHCGFEPVQQGSPAEVEKTGKLYLKARVHDLANWALLRERLLRAAAANSFTLKVCLDYFLRTNRPDSEVVKAWVVVVLAKDMLGALQALSQSVKEAPVVHVTLDEFPLPGGGRHRIQGQRGKGAQATPYSRPSGPSFVR